MLIDVFNLWQVGDRNAVALIDPSMSAEQEKLIVETIGENGRVALISMRMMPEGLAAKML